MHFTLLCYIYSDVCIELWHTHLSILSWYNTKVKLQGSTLPKDWINIHNYECCRYHHRQTHPEQRHLFCKFVTLNQSLMIQETNTTLTNKQLDVCSVCWLGFVNLIHIGVIHLRRGSASCGIASLRWVSGFVWEVFFIFWLMICVGGPSPLWVVPCLSRWPSAV